jgi:DNA-binding response OmpR family regulator
MNEKIKILVVDDEPDIVEMLSYNLIREGYEVLLHTMAKKQLLKLTNINQNSFYWTL